MKGIVKQDDFVAVVADNWWRANQAAKAGKLEWDGGKYANASDDTIRAMLKRPVAASCCQSTPSWPWL